MCRSARSLNHSPTAQGHCSSCLNACVISVRWSCLLPQIFSVSSKYHVKCLGKFFNELLLFRFHILPHCLLRLKFCHNVLYILNCQKVQWHNSFSEMSSVTVLYHYQQAVTIFSHEKKCLVNIARMSSSLSHISATSCHKLSQYPLSHSPLSQCPLSRHPVLLRTITALCCDRLTSPPLPSYLSHPSSPSQPSPLTR